jgi:hypothetical protein
MHDQVREYDLVYVEAFASTALQSWHGRFKRNYETHLHNHMCIFKCIAMLRPNRVDDGSLTRDCE